MSRTADHETRRKPGNRRARAHAQVTSDDCGPRIGDCLSAQNAEAARRAQCGRNGQRRRGIFYLGRVRTGNFTCARWKHQRE